MIYFVRDDATGLVKIGRSNDPWSRLCKMQTDCPGNLTLVGLRDGGSAEELAIHSECASQRVRGEWFRAEGPVLTHMAAAADLVKPERVRETNPSAALVVELCAATSLGANTVRAWLQRGRVPTGWIAQVARAGVIDLHDLCEAARLNGRRFRKPGAPLNVTLEALASARRAGPSKQEAA